MLDALMGGDRNAPLPAGAAVKRSAEAPLLLPAKRRKSCYDGDICPLYCAWNGVDVYELFVNTKSDLGPNPKLPNDAAAQEFQQLPKHEQDRLGFKGLLFRKLQDLCRQCDRTVARNKEKLVQERRQKATSQNFVQEVDERALEQVCRAKIHEQYIKEELENKVRELDRVLQEERQLRELYEEETKKTASEEEEEVKKETEQDEEKGGSTARRKRRMRLANPRKWRRKRRRETSQRRRKRRPTRIQAAFLQKTRRQKLTRMTMLLHKIRPETLSRRTEMTRRFHRNCSRRCTRSC